MSEPFVMIWWDRTAFSHRASYNTWIYGTGVLYPVTYLQGLFHTTYPCGTDVFHPIKYKSIKEKNE